MDWKQILSVIEIVLSVLLIVAILLQQQGSGLGSLFGGGGGGETYRTKRGADKLFYNLTIIAIVLFVVNGLAIAILSANR